MPLLAGVRLLLHHVLLLHLREITRKLLLHTTYRSESCLWLLHLAGKSCLVDWQVGSLSELFVVEIVILRLA